MGRFASDTGGGDFKPAPAGNHIARCIALIDIGTHHDEYEGKPTVRNQVIMQWELPNETTEIDGKSVPFIVSKFYTNSLGEKANLRKDLEAWRSRPFTPEELMKFDLQAVLDKPCMLNVIHTDKGKAKVTAVTPLPKGIACAPAVNTPYAFWIEPWDDNAFHSLSKGFQKLVMESDEYKALGGFMSEDEPEVREVDDTIPF